jgi:hypothetical protein
LWATLKIPRIVCTSIQFALVHTIEWITARQPRHFQGFLLDFPARLCRRQQGQAKATAAFTTPFQVIACPFRFSLADSFNPTCSTSTMGRKLPVEFGRITQDNVEQVNDDDNVAVLGVVA